MFSLFFSLTRNMISLCLNVLGSNVFLRYITLHVSRLVYALTISSGLNFCFNLMITKLRNGRNTVDDVRTLIERLVD